MNEKQREIYQKIEEMRNSKIITYITSDRPGLETQIANDATDYFVEHLDKIGKVPKISLFLYTCGGNTLAGWNIINLIRQFCDDLEIIVPSKARSTGTLMCLGANRIVMTKQATLGPIDPSMNNPLNPKVIVNGKEITMPVSVEAIKGFLELAKHEIGADERSMGLVFQKLAESVHPLVLGQAYRAIGQIQMLAERLLTYQVTDKDKIKRIISFLCSESGSHDYTIDRREAKDVLGLSVEKPNDELYQLIRSAYYGVREELKIEMPFVPAAILGAETQKEYCERRVLIESLAGGTDAFISEGEFKRVTIPSNPTALAINDQRLFEGWRHYDE